MLSYYSMPISARFISEGAMALYLSNKTNADANGQYSVDRLLSTVYTLSNLLKDEQLNYGFEGEVDLSKVKSRVKFFTDSSVIKLSDDNQKVLLQENDFGKGTLKYGAHLIMPLIDTYIVVLLTIDAICGKNIVVNQKTLVKELHTTFKTLYTEDKLIPYLASCIKDISKTAISRFTDMGLVQA